MNLMGRSGSHRRTSFTSCLVQSGTVLCRRPKVVSTDSEVSNTLRKGRAQGRLVQGGVTRSIRQSHAEATADPLMLLRRADRVMVIAALGNMGSPSPFQCFVNHDFNRRSQRDKRPNEKHQQEVTEKKGRPAST